VAKATHNDASIQEALAELLRTCPKSRRVVADILQWLEQIQRQRTNADHAQPAGRRRQPRARRGAAIKGYKIELGRNDEETLIERRYDSPKDFRCGYDVYIATAGTLAKAPKGGMSFDAILEGATKQLGWQPPEYLPRLCARFWSFGKEPIVIRSRARYQPMASTKFLQQAKNTWRKLAKRAKS